MDTIRIEFPADRPDVARAFADALARIADPAEHHQAMARAIDAAASDHPEDDRPNEQAETAASPAGESPPASNAHPTAEDPPADGRPVDQKGVPYDGGYCGNAQDPFYGSGPRAGQWKKKRGVSEADYDRWYAEQLANLAESDGASNEYDQGAPVNTGAAFRPAGQQQQTPAQVEGPKTAPELLTWVAEQQAGGHVTQAQVQAAYADNRLGVQDLFPPTPPAQIEHNVRTVYLALRGGQ